MKQMQSPDEEMLRPEMETEFFINIIFVNFKQCTLFVYSPLFAYAHASAVVYIRAHARKK